MLSVFFAAAKLKLVAAMVRSGEEDLMIEELQSPDIVKSKGLGHQL